MTFDLPLLAAAAAGWLAGMIIGYALRSYISHRRRRRHRRGPMAHYPLSPPSRKMEVSIEAPALAPNLHDTDESSRPNITRVR